VNDRINEGHRDLFPLFDNSESGHPTAPQSSGEQPRNFGAPFDRTDADLIIRSSDQVDFHVHKAILGIASVVFDDMFTAPGPSPSEQGQSNPVINLTEDSKTLRCVLTLIYPVDPSIPETLEDALSLFATCQKYQMDSTATRIRSLLRDHVPPLFTAQNSFRAYGISRRYHLKQEAQVAARLTLECSLNFNECGEDLRFMSGTDLFQLQEYRTECIKVVKDCIRGEDRNTPYAAAWCYNHFLKRVADKPSPTWVTDRQAYETAMQMNRDPYSRHLQSDATRLFESIRTKVEVKLKVVIDEVSIVLASQLDLT